jgi:putative transposase
VGGSGLAADSKKARAEHAHIALIDETGLLLNPLVRRSWAPRGQTPVVGGDGGHRRKVSVIGAVSASPAARHLGLYFATLPDGFFTAGAVAGFLRGLLGHLRGKVVAVWDGGGNHKGPQIRELLRRNERLSLERLPAYAPELNPAEQVWSWLKYGQLANFVPHDLAELDDEIADRLIHLKCDAGLLRALWDGSKLPFPDQRDR